MRLSVAVLGLAAGLVASIAGAAEYLIDIKTDLNAKFYVVEKGGSAELPTLVVKRVRIQGTPNYTKRVFDCRNHSVQVLGSGSSLEAMAKAEPEDKSFPVEEGSINAQLWRHACYGK